MEEEWMVQPEGSFVPRSTIIIVTFDQGELVVGFMDQCFFCLSSKLPPQIRERGYTAAHKTYARASI